MHGDVHANMRQIEYHDGHTLLHGATDARMRRYAELLVNYNFDILRQSEQNSQRSYSISITKPSRIREYYDSILVV